MKKNIFYVLGISMIVFASCAKDRTCTCTTSSDIPLSSTSTSVQTESHLTKKTGKRVLNCYSYKEAITGTSYTKTVACELK
jgi:hypothetical protein